MAQWSLTSESRRAGGACRIERRLEPIDHLVAGLIGLEQAHRAFEPKHLLDAFPLLSKPVIEIRTTKDLAVFQAPMSFVPRLRLSPSSPIWGAIFQQIGDILS